MYVTGWAAPLIIVGLSASYGLANDMYIQPNNGNTQCETGQILFPFAEGVWNCILNFLQNIF